MERRTFLLSGALGLSSVAFGAEPEFAQVRPGVPLRFPRDHGAHPAFRNEWWYVTGILRTEAKQTLGFQITFFRTRLPFDTHNPSRFTPRQLLLAHAALSERDHGRLRHDQRAAREALGLAGAALETTRAWVDDWHFLLAGGRYEASIRSREFAIALQLDASAPLLHNGTGLSRKGRRPGEASYYYSRPQMPVRGTIEREQGKDTVTGSAWLDHEWSSTVLAPEAAGWDWVGINLDDGGALMAFRIRAKAGGTYYAGATLRDKDGRVRSFAPGEVVLSPRKSWRSPRSGVDYPIVMELELGGEAWLLEPFMEDQEFDARASAGTIYWEGAVRATRSGQRVGEGYLELTGYWKPLEL